MCSRMKLVAYFHANDLYKRTSYRSPVVHRRLDCNNIQGREIVTRTLDHLAASDSSSTLWSDTQELIITTSMPSPPCVSSAPSPRSSTNPSADQTSSSLTKPTSSSSSHLHTKSRRLLKPGHLTRAHPPAIKRLPRLPLSWSTSVSFPPSCQRSTKTVKPGGPRHKSATRGRTWISRATSPS